MLPIPRHILCYIDFHSTAHIYGYRASNDRLLKHTEKKKQFTRKMMLKNGWEKYHVKRKTTYNMLWNALQFEYKQRYMNNLLLFAHARSLPLICSLCLSVSSCIRFKEIYIYFILFWLFSIWIWVLYDILNCSSWRQQHILLSFQPEGILVGCFFFLFRSKFFLIINFAVVRLARNLFFFLIFFSILMIWLLLIVINKWIMITRDETNSQMTCCRSNKFYGIFFCSISTQKRKKNAKWKMQQTLWRELWNSWWNSHLIKTKTQWTNV